MTARLAPLRVSGKIAPLSNFGSHALQSSSRRTDLVLRIVNELLDHPANAAGILPGDVNTKLRELGTPMGAWEVRGELANLAAAGVLVVDPDTTRWTRVPPAAPIAKRSGTA
jgi:hypothetical protein